MARQIAQTRILTGGAFRFETCHSSSWKSRASCCERRPDSRLPQRWFHSRCRAGYAGLEDGVDNHWGQLFRAAGLATILNIGLETGEDGGDEIAEAIRDGTQDTIGRAGEAIVQRQLQIPPTLTIRPGFPVRVMVTRDLILEPQGDAR